MEEVIYYLELKNKYYEKFLSVTQRFIDQIRQDRWENMEYFMDNRERILNIIRSYDFKIAELFAKVDISEQRLEQYSVRVKALLERREALGRRIIDQDLELIGKVDEARTDTIRELKQTQENAQKLGSFVSAPPAARRKASKDV